MILISNLILSIKDGSTIASTEIYGADKKTYINIGSGNVFKLSWNTPALTDDIVDHYSLIIKRHDTTLNVYYDIFNKNIGLVNDFYVDSALLPAVPLQYMLSIYVIAYGKQGSVITSNVVNPYISKGSGTYVKVEEATYAQPIMKRALAFVKIALSSSEGETLSDIEDRLLYTADIPVAKTEFVLTDYNGKVLMDDNEKTLFAEATKVLESTDGWTVVQEGYTKDNAGNWRANDIKYEVLVDQSGAIITDSSGEPIYML